MPGERHIYVRAIRRAQPDLQRLSRAIIALALQAAQEEQARRQDEAATTGPGTNTASQPATKPEAAA